MSRDRRNRYDQYNLDKLDSLITVALIANQKSVLVPKRLYKLAKQFMAANNIKDLKIKTY